MYSFHHSAQAQQQQQGLSWGYPSPHQYPAQAPPYQSQSPVSMTHHQHYGGHQLFHPQQYSQQFPQQYGQQYGQPVLAVPHQQQPQQFHSQQQQAPHQEGWNRDRSRQRGQPLGRKPEVEEPITDPSAYCNLFVAPLPKTVRNDDLLKIFEPYNANHASVMMDVHTGRSKGFGFVTFEDPNHGSAAMQALQGAPVVSPTGEEYVINISASHHKKSSSLNESRHVYFRNIPTSLTHDEIHETLNQFGEIVSISVKLDNQQRWFLASIEYVSIEAAKQAVERGHGKVLFPKHSTFPVMTKFADNSQTKAARKERRVGIQTGVAPAYSSDQQQLQEQEVFPPQHHEHAIIQGNEMYPANPAAPTPTDPVEPQPFPAIVDLSHASPHGASSPSPLEEDDSNDNPLSGGEDAPRRGSGGSLASSHSDFSAHTSSSSKYRRNPYNMDSVTVGVQ